MVRALVADGVVPGIADTGLNTWATGGPPLGDVVTVVGALASGLYIADSPTLRTVLSYVAASLRRGHKPDPEGGNELWAMHISSPHSWAHIELTEEPTAEELTQIVEVVLRRPDDDT
jgi:hypothetical protein